MSDPEQLLSTTDPSPEDREPPSPGTMRSWGADWRVEPFKKDIKYVQWLQNLDLLVGRTEEDKRQDERTLEVDVTRRARITEEYFKPATEPKPKTGPQRLGEFVQRAIRRQS